MQQLKTAGAQTQPWRSSKPQGTVPSSFRSHIRAEPMSLRALVKQEAFRSDSRQSSLQRASPPAAVATDVAPADVAVVQEAVEKPIDWMSAWYPVAFEVDIAKDKPYKFELLQTPLVIWWDPKGQNWVVQADLCPHRLVPLSEGRINESGHLECGYHGWEFNPEGSCVKIPQGGNPSRFRACISKYPSIIRQGLLWVWPKALPHGITMEDSASGVDMNAIPIVPELEDPSWFSQDTWRDLPYDYSTLMENVIDSSHVPFTHHISISNRNIIGDFKLSLDSPVEDKGFNGSWATGPRAGQLGPQYTEFNSPCYMKHTLDASAKKGFKSLTVVYAVPMGPGRSRVINRNTVRFDKTALPTKLLRLLPGWWSHVGSHVPLEDDQIFLHIGEAEYMKRRIAGQSPTSAYFLASPADVLVAAYRTWLDKFGGGGPFGPPTPELMAKIAPRQSLDQLLDRYSQHTYQCATCQKGLKQVNQVADAASLLSTIALGSAILTAAVAVALSLAPSLASTTTTAALATSASSASAGGLSAMINTVASTAAAALIAALKLVVGNSADPAGLVLRAGAWGVVSAGGAQVCGKARAYASQFSRGSYPPRRNTDKAPPPPPPAPAAPTSEKATAA